MPFNIIPTEEFPPNHQFGDYILFDHCAYDERPKHIYQFRIADYRHDISAMVNAYYTNPKVFAPLEEYNISIVSEFCYQAFLKVYSFDSRNDFLDYQFNQSPAKQLFLNRVQNLLTVYDWDCYKIDFGDRDIKKEEVLNWLAAKIAILKTGVIKKDLSHRHHALIYYYLREAGYLPWEFHRKEVREKFGKAREKAIDTIWNKTASTYKTPNKDELEKILPFLRVYNNAFKLVHNELEKLTRFI